MYVDDMLIIGKKEQIQEFAIMIQKEFSVKIQHNLADYLGCEFHMNKEKIKGWLGQPSIIKNLKQKFGERAMKEKLSMTPGTPRFIARRLENKEDKVNAEDHETYRSGVGTLLYLMKHSRPDISNPVRELTEVWHMAHFWVSYDRCTMPGLPMGRSEGLSRNLDRLGASMKKHQEKCTIACFESSHGSLTMLGSPVGPFVGSSWR